MNFFDYVIANQDRPGNYLVKDGRYVLIDNGQAFMPGAKPLRSLSPEDMRLPDEDLARLASLGRADFLRALEPYVGTQAANESFARFTALLKALGRPVEHP